MKSASELSPRQQPLIFIPKLYLSPVGMAAEREVDAPSCSLAKDYGVMGEQQLHFVGIRSAESSREIGFADHMVVYPREPEGRSPRLESLPLVNQNIYAFAAKKMRHQIGVRPMIVVAETCVYAELGMKTS